MIPYKFLDIENHKDITSQLEKLFLGELYLNVADNGDFIFTFDKQYVDQKKYDITKHERLWNYVILSDLYEKCPDIKLALDKIGLAASSCSVLVISYDGSGSRLGLHSDASFGKIPYRLNWPVYQCLSGTKTSMYKLKPGSINLLATGETSYTPPSQDIVAKSETGIYRLQDIESEIASFIMDRPLLFRFTVPHRVYDIEPRVPYPRILISFDLVDNQSDLMESLTSDK